MPVLSPAAWFHYSGTRRLVRCWTFAQPYPPLNAVVGELLYEDAEEFHIRASSGDWKTHRDLEPWQVEPLLAETGDAPFEIAERLHRRGGRIAPACPSR